MPPTPLTGTIDKHSVKRRVFFVIEHISAAPTLRVPFVMIEDKA
jgi:hypothetical protein